MDHGCPILRAVCEGWDTKNLDTGRRLSHPLQKRKGWGTRLFVVIPELPNTNRGLIENLFFSRKLLGYFQSSAFGGL